MLITHLFFIISILYVSGLKGYRIPRASFGGSGGGGGGAYSAAKQKLVEMTVKLSRGAKVSCKNSSTSTSHIIPNSKICLVINESIEDTDNKGEDIKEETDFADKRKIYGYQPFFNPIFKYILPGLLGECLIATLCFTFVLSDQMLAASPMSRASVSLLIAIAIADVLTTGFGLSEICYRFNKTIGNPGFLPFSSCRTNYVMEVLIWIFHEASVWFTVILTAQRYACVSRPFLARRCFNLRTSLTCVLWFS